MFLFLLFFTTIASLTSIGASERGDSPFSANKLTRINTTAASTYPNVLLWENNTRITHKLITYVYKYEENDNKPPHVFALQADTGRLIWEMTYRDIPKALSFKGHDLIIIYDTSIMRVNSLSCEMKSIWHDNNPQKNITDLSYFKKKTRRLSVS